MITKEKNSIRKKGKFQNTVRRLFMYYAYIPAGITLIVISVLYYMIINVTYWNNTKETSKITANRVERFYDYYRDFLMDFATTDSGSSTDFKSIKSNELYEKVYKFLGTQDVRAHILLFNESNEVLLELDIPNDSIKKFLINNIIPKLDRQKGNLIIETGRIQNSGAWGSYYIMGHKISSDEETQGYIFAVISGDAMKKIFAANNLVSEIIVDDFDYVLGKSVENLNGDVLGKFYLEATGNRICKLNGEKKYYVHHYIDRANLHIYTMKDVGVTIQDMLPLIYILLLISVVLYVGLQTYSKKLAFRVTEPVDKLMVAVSELQQGNFKTRVSIESDDEFEVLAYQYNIMTEQIERLLEEKKELILVQKETEIQNLKIQFNPHFLFNILETIRYAILVDTKKALEMIMELSRLLRYSVNRSDKPAVLVDDFEYIESYLNLQKNRFGDRLSYEIYIDKETEYARIPQLLIQPIVENSIKYGMRNQMFIMINITCKVIDGEVIIDIEDNGGGMKEVEFVRLKERLNGTHNMVGSIGLYNSHRMLKLMYGDKYGLEFKNEEGKSFFVRVRLPFIETVDTID